MKKILKILVLGGILLGTGAVVVVSKSAINDFASETTATKELPRFASLKYNEINVRMGPSDSHDVMFKYVRKQLPVEIIQEGELWFKVRDHEGMSGWVRRYQVSNRRTALTVVQGNDVYVDLFKEQDENSVVVARVGNGHILYVDSCQDIWCKVEIDNIKGYVPKTSLWGVYLNELIQD